MVLVSQAQLFEGAVMDIVVDNNIIKVVGNLKGVIKISFATIINRDQQINFMGGFAYSSGDSSKMVDQFVVWGGV